MNIRLSRRLRPLVVVAVAALALSSCSATDKNSDSGGGADTKVSSGGLKGDPVVIGTLCSCTGPLAGSIGRSLDVIKAWASWTNANGGINDHPVKLIAYDDGLNPATGLAMAKKLVEQDHVQAIVGEMSLVASSWAKYVDGKGIPVVGGQPLDSNFVTDPNWYPSGTTLPGSALGGVTAAKNAGAKTLGLYYCDEAPVCAQLPALFGPLAAKFGMKTVSQSVSATAPNYIAPCTSFKQKSVDAIIGGVNSDVMPRIAESCGKQSFNPVWIGSSNSTDQSWTTTAALDGSVFTATDAVYTDTSIPGVKDFNDALAKYAPGLQDSAQFSFPLIYPWAGGQLFASAAKAANLSPTSTSADIVKGLTSLKDETLDGVAPPLNFTAGKVEVPNCYFTGTIKDGGFHSDAGAQPVCLDQATADAVQHAIAGG